MGRLTSTRNRETAGEARTFVWRHRKYQILWLAHSLGNSPGFWTHSVNSRPFLMQSLSRTHLMNSSRNVWQGRTIVSSESAGLGWGGWCDQSLLEGAARETGLHPALHGKNSIRFIENLRTQRKLSRHSQTSSLLLRSHGEVRQRCWRCGDNEPNCSQCADRGGPRGCAAPDPDLSEGSRCEGVRSRQQAAGHPHR